ncbi:MAG: WD40 repeat domain-containing protein [Granulosicoccus sp.]|nr:WD40 repeat domain-containing protein [Granulosicoccus sp.]
MRLLFTLLVVTSLIYACDSDGSSQSGLNDPIETSGGLLNGGLVGRVVTANNDLLPIEIDLATGLTRLLPVRTIQEGLPGENWERGAIQGYFSANLDGTSYVQSIVECRRDNDAGFNDLYIYDSCAAVYDSGLAINYFFAIPNTQIDGAVKISRSGSYVAYNEFERASETFSMLYIADLAAGMDLEQYDIPIDNNGSAGESPFAWGPDDILIYSVPSDERISLYITNPVSWAPARTINLSAERQGEVTSLEFSPDGTKILIGYDPPGPYSGSVLILDLNSLDVTTPVVDVRDANTIPLLDDVKGNLVSPRWSPDGRHIMVVSESSGAGPIIDPTTGEATVIADTNILYAVPADASLTVVNGSQPTAAIAIAASRPSGGELTTSFQGYLTFDFPYYDWVP